MVPGLFLVGYQILKQEPVLLHISVLQCVINVPQ